MLKVIKYPCFGFKIANISDEKRIYHNLSHIICDENKGQNSTKKNN